MRLSTVLVPPAEVLRKSEPYHRKRTRYPCERAFQEADVDLKEISLFEAHGSGLHDEDAIESNALNAISAGKGVHCAVNSTKPLSGIWARQQVCCP